jgi:hypothetical protein
LQLPALERHALPHPQAGLNKPWNPMSDNIPEPVQQDRIWSDERWTARVIKNEDDDGWAVAMMLHGESEPALVGPWTMGRDKKNPKPLDISAFHTLVKTANEVLRRHEQQLHAQLHRNVTVTSAKGSRIRVSLAIVPDEDGATASLTAEDEFGEVLGKVAVSPGFQLNTRSALAWVESGFARLSD